MDTHGNGEEHGKESQKEFYTYEIYLDEQGEEARVSTNTGGMNWR